jgi:hypothetical protein
MWSPQGHRVESLGQLGGAHTAERQSSGGQTMETVETFGLSRRWCAVLLVAIMIPALALIVSAVWDSLPFTLAVRITGETFVYGFFMWLFAINVTTVTIREHSLTLRRVWKIHWQDVVAARRCSVLGLAYLRIVRSGRWPANLWLPLYLVGRRSLILALYERTPPSNPIHQCLEPAVAKVRAESGVT